MSQNALEGYITFFGFAISILATFYFAIEFIPDVSPWSQVAALVLMALCFALLGVWIGDTTIGEPFFQGPRLRWLRPSVVLYLMSLVSAIVADIRFLSIDDLARPVKILISLLLGILLIVVAARRRGSAKPESPSA